MRVVYIVTMHATRIPLSPRAHIVPVKFMKPNKTPRPVRTTQQSPYHKPNTRLSHPPTGRHSSLCSRSQSWGVSHPASDNPLWKHILHIRALCPELCHIGALFGEDQIRCHDPPRTPQQDIGRPNTIVQDTTGVDTVDYRKRGILQALQSRLAYTVNGH